MSPKVLETWLCVSVCMCVNHIIHSRYRVLQLLTRGCFFKWWTVSNTHTHIHTVQGERLKKIFDETTVTHEHPGVPQYVPWDPSNGQQRDKCVCVCVCVPPASNDPAHTKAPRVTFMASRVMPLERRKEIFTFIKVSPQALSPFHAKLKRTLLIRQR